jgi:hypothetical protein
MMYDNLIMGKKSQLTTITAAVSADTSPKKVNNSGKNVQYIDFKCHKSIQLSSEAMIDANFCGNKQALKFHDMKLSDGKIGYCGGGAGFVTAGQSACCARIQHQHQANNRSPITDISFANNAGGLDKRSLDFSRLMNDRMVGNAGGGIGTQIESLVYVTYPKCVQLSLYTLHFFVCVYFKH